MSRSRSHSHRRRHLLRLAAALAATWVSLPASVLANARRPIPPAAKRAEMRLLQNGFVQLGSVVLRLAAGAQIRDGANRIVMPVAVQQPVLVRYLLDARGDLWRVWILTAEEAAQPDPQ